MKYSRKMMTLNIKSSECTCNKSHEIPNRPIQSVYQTFDMGVHETSFKLIARYVNRAECMSWPFFLVYNILKKELL